MLILASLSTTRAALLREAGVRFVQQASPFDEEQIAATDPKEFVFQATMGKYRAFAATQTDTIPILCADTVVTAGGAILRKAANREEARAILLQQSGAVVSIVTCMFYHSKALTLLDMAATHYQFTPFDKATLEEYLNSGLWEGKAGACMVEGFCKPYILSVHGLESTAMGLAVEHLLPFIQDDPYYAAQ